MVGKNNVPDNGTRPKTAAATTRIYYINVYVIIFIRCADVRSLSSPFSRRSFKKKTEFLIDDDDDDDDPRRRRDHPRREQLANTVISAAENTNLHPSSRIFENIS